jgi:hypothetical protein
MAIVELGLPRSDKTFMWKFVELDPEYLPVLFERDDVDAFIATYNNCMRKI